MEIGHQPVDRPEAVAGRDEDGGVAFERLDPSILVRRTFQQTQRSRSDRDQPPAGLARGIEPVGGRLIDAAPFGVHPMVGGVVNLDRQERPRADMKRQRLPLHAAPVERFDQPIGEMQRRGRRGDCPRLSREHRLIIVAVGLVGSALACNIGGSGICPARSSSSSTGSSPWKWSRIAPSSSRATALAFTPSPKSIKSPSRTRLALRTNAHQLLRPSRLWRVAPMLASPRRPSSCAGMTRCR